MKDLEELRQRIRKFAQVRDWDQFHSPKNLSMALAAEAGELLEKFQWLTEQQSSSLSPEKKEEIAEEMADVLVYLVRLADKLDVDLLETAEKKMAKNEEKYPADKVKGSAKKYTEYSKDEK